MTRTSPPHIDRIHLARNTSPIGIGQTRPTVSWGYTQSSTTSREWMQRAYELKVLRSGAEKVHKGETDQCVALPWPAEEEDLKSGERFALAVRAQGTDQIWTEWSDTVQAEASLLHKQDWKAEIIGADQVPPANLPKRPFYVRTTFELSASDVDKNKQHGVRIYATALGVYNLYLNGQRVGDHVLAPGWQSYDHRLHLQTYVVPPELFQPGPNILGALVGEGWYAGHLTWAEGYRNIWGAEIGVGVQLVLPGKEVRSGAEGWEWTYGPILSSELYDGETYDTTLIDEHWCSPKSKSTWRPVKPIPFPEDVRLIAPEAPPIRVTEEVKPVEVITTPKGKKIIDFGQNLVGWVRIDNLLAHKGTAPGLVKLRFAEVLDKGEIGMRPLRDAKATDIIHLGKRNVEGWEPSFTTHGFRYVEVNGIVADRDNFTAVVVHSDMERLGDFECSHPSITKLHKNIVWGLKGNFVGVPTDCPQRDERLGWTGDLQVFTPTASLLYDTAGFLADWLDDLASEQLKEGNNVPGFVVPNVLHKLGGDPTTFIAAQPVWCDVAVLTPQALWTAFGGRQVLDDQYESMKAWVDKGIPRRENGLWHNKDDVHYFADWLDPTAPPEDAAAAMTDPILVADSYLIGVLDAISQVARTLGKDDDSRRYKKEHDELLDVFRSEYVTPTGRLACDSQTAYVLALQFDLLTSEQRKIGVERLVHLITKNRYRIGTGFAGTPVILDMLARHGQLETAYKMLEETKCPSWLYPVSMGATTIWERWDSMLPDGSINPGEMTSFNHYALGSVGHFLYTVVAGISPAEPGWKVINIRPRPGGSLTSAKAHHLTPYGRVKCEWYQEKGTLKIKVEVPPNTTAVVQIPGQDEKQVGSGLHEWSVQSTTDA